MARAPGGRRRVRGSDATARQRTIRLALAIAVGVELLQLTPIPAAVVDAVPAARLLFGSAFDPWDLAAYLGGAVALFVLLRVITRARTRAISAAVPAQPSGD